MGDSSIDRRRFLVSAIALSGIGCSPLVLRLSTAWAQSGAAPSATMVRLARLLIPYDALDDSVYAQVLGTAMAVLPGDPSIAVLLQEAEAELDAQQDADFMSLDEDAQVAALVAVGETRFFAPILGALKLLFYGHPATWSVMKYEGPSWQQGGYLGRGAGEIDWLAEVE